MKIQLVLLCLCLVFSAHGFSEEPYEHKAGYFECKRKIYESEFSGWFLVSDMQKIFDQMPKDKFWVYQEGRNHKGKAQIRWIERSRPAKFGGYWIRGMLSRKDFHEFDAKYRAEGLRRISTQVFEDRKGVLRYQAVWIVPAKADPSSDS